MLPLPSDPQISKAIINKYFQKEEWENDFNGITGETKAIADYTGLNFEQVLDLPISLFLLYRKEAWIYANSRTESGKEFLRDLWRLRQTKPDLDAVHRFQKRKGR